MLAGTRHAPCPRREVVSAVMISASLDWAAMTIAAALVAKDEPTQNGSGIMRATTVMRP